MDNPEERKARLDARRAYLKSIKSNEDLSFMEKVMMGSLTPLWACRQWGQYEHDWMGCHECLPAYEKWLEQKENEGPDEDRDDEPDHERHPGVDGP